MAGAYGKIWFTVTLLSAVLFGAAGLLVPVHFGAQSRVVMEAAGSGTPSLRERARDYLDLGRIGPAELVLAAGDEGSLHPAVRMRTERIVENNPVYRVTGGPAPYVEQFLKEAPRPPKPDAEPSFITLLAGSDNRADMAEFLEGSSKPAVEAILSSRQMTGLAQFMPVGTAGGAPLEASILTTALLVQGDYFPPAVSVEVARMAQATRWGGPEAIAEAEQFYLGILALGRQLNWMQLVELARVSDGLEAIPRLASVMRYFPEQLPTLYAAVAVSGRPGAVADYLELQMGGSGWADLGDALQAGEGAVRLLLDEQEPLWTPPGWLGWTETFAWPPLVSFARDFPAQAMLLKLALFLLGGLFFAFALARLVRGVASEEEMSLWDVTGLLRHGMLAAVVVAILVALNEPRLFSAKAERMTQLNLNLNLPVATANPTDGKESVTMTNLDQVTLLVLGIFFVLQMVIYLVCLIRIAHIRNHSAPPNLKIRLLENEEVLFDAGLYVGLSGTVASLIMLAMGIVEASLVAAYASTLFGIIFVAVLKIFHVRPFKRALVIEHERWG